MKLSVNIYRKKLVFLKIRENLKKKKKIIVKMRYFGLKHWILLLTAFVCGEGQVYQHITQPPEKIPLGAIFEQGTDEVQSAFKYAMLHHNKNESARRFELQAYVDVINTADAFKLSRLSKKHRNACGGILIYFFYSFQLFLFAAYFS